MSTLRTGGRLAGGRPLAIPYGLGRLLLFVAAAGALAWWLWPSAHERRQVAPGIPTPVAGTRTLSVPLVLELVVDESGSTQQSDPGGRRHAEAAAVASWMSRYSENPHDEIGLVRFASTANGFSPVPVAQASAALQSAFGQSSDSLGGDTDLGPAVSLVEKDLEQHAGARRVVVLLTDGQLQDMPSIRSLVRRLRSVAEDVYLIGLNADGTWSSTTRTAYQGLGLNLLTLDSFTANRLAETVARVILRETGQRVK